MAIFNSYVKLPEGRWQAICGHRGSQHFRTSLTSALAAAAQLLVVASHTTKHGLANSVVLFTFFCAYIYTTEPIGDRTTMAIDNHMARYNTLI